VWITLKEPVENADISWKTGNARIAYRSSGLNEKDLITADTAFLHWETPPPIRLDSIETTKSGDSIKTWRIDSAYVDTIFAIVDGLRSEPVIVKVRNILPNIKSFSVAGLEQPGDSTITIAAHPGDRLEIAIRFEKTFNKAYSPVIEGLDILGEGENFKPTRSDSVYSWEWIVPQRDIDTTALLRIKDSNGYGERLYKIRLVVYPDFGSVWVASEKEVVKYSPSGARVARIRDTFDVISDIAVNSNNGRLFVIDQSKNTFAVYDSYGKQISKNTSLLKNPTGIAVDIDGNYVWVADSDRLRPFTVSGSDIVANANLEYSLAGRGQVKGLSPDQFEREFLWFAIPERDTVGYIHFVASPTTDKVPEYKPNNKPGKWNRPSMVSLDPVNGLAWIADSSRILAIDADGKEFAIISDFGFVSSVSAAGGSVWASDILRGRVYHFPGPFKGTERDLSRTVMDGMIVEEGFSAPVFVSAFIADGSAWVMDKGTGKTVRVDSLGNITAEGIGLIPFIGKTIQKVE